MPRSVLNSMPRILSIRYLLSRMPYQVLNVERPFTQDESLAPIQCLIPGNKARYARENIYVTQPISCTR